MSMSKDYDDLRAAMQALFGRNNLISLDFGAIRVEQSKMHSHIEEDTVPAVRVSFKVTNHAVAKVGAGASLSRIRDRRVGGS